VLSRRRPGTKGAIRAQKLGLIAVIAAAIGMSPAQAAAAATSGGVKITLTCELGTAGTGTFKVTANGSSSLVTVPCDGSATVTNPSWMPGATATIDQTVGPVGTVLAKNQRVYLATYAASFFTSAHACSPAFTAPECPPASWPARRATSLPWWMLAALIGFLLLTILGAILAPVWIIGQQIRYFHRLYFDKPEAFREAMRNLALMPGMAWRIRLRSKLLRVPLPAGFEDAEQVIREDKQRL
jgi:hypothetical protein